MPKTSKVLHAAFSHEWDGKDCKFYDHNIEFENGDRGQYTSKTKEQNKFVEGRETEYTIEPSKRAGFFKIKPIQQPIGGGGRGGGLRPASFDEQIEVARAKYPSFAVSYWKDVLVALINSGTTPEEAITLTHAWPLAFFKKMNELSEGK